MGEVVAVLVVFASFGAVIAGLLWLAARVRRRGIGGDLMGMADQIFRPTAHESRLEVEAQEERLAPMPSPDDKLIAQLREDRRPGAR